MKTLQVVGQTNKIPFASRRGQSAQGELSEAHDLLDDAEDRLNRALAQFVDGVAGLGV